MAAATLLPFAATSTASATRSSNVGCQWSCPRPKVARLPRGNCFSSCSIKRDHRGAFPAAGGRSCRHAIVFASPEEIPSEILEDSKFVPISKDDPRFGPPALLLLGFTNEEAVKVQSLLKDMEGDFMQVLLCTQEMAEGTLGKAFDAVQPDLIQIEVAKGLPRISFLSGLTGEEIMMLIQVFPEAGLKPAVFAAHVPLNSEKSMEELMGEIMDDHQRLSKQREAVKQNES